MTKNTPNTTDELKTELLSSLYILYQAFNPEFEMESDDGDTTSLRNDFRKNVGGYLDSYIDRICLNKDAAEILKNALRGVAEANSEYKVHRALGVTIRNILESLGDGDLTEELVTDSIRNALGGSDGKISSAPAPERIEALMFSAL